MILRALSLLFCLALAAPAQRPSGQKPGTASGEADPTALGALALLPKGAAENVARIEGPDGQPFPERWYVLVHDPKAPRGLKEFVVAAGKLVTSRELSQFADTLTEEDVIGEKAIKVNSDRAAGIAAQFAMFNGGQLASIRYELIKGDETQVPEWQLTCADAKGQALGSVALHATKGTLLRFDGFEKSPMEPEAAIADAEEKPAPVAAKPPKRSSSASSSSDSASRRQSTPPPRAKPVRRPPPPRQGPVDRVGGLFRRIFRD